MSTGDELGTQGEVQLDAPTATCKLLLAAAGHGAETVATYAAEFAAHGMIEVRNIHLLKGVQVSEAQRLDDYCTLVPYREALEKANADPSKRVHQALLPQNPRNRRGDCFITLRTLESGH